MSRIFRVAILSDIHYAGPQERAAGDDYELQAIQNPLLRFVLRQYRNHIWLRAPLQQNGQLERFLGKVPEVDYAVANGDYTCNVAALGLADAAAQESAQECLGKLRAKFGTRLRLVCGDHELGKLRLFGSRGGMRLASWNQWVIETEGQTFWKLELGHYVLFHCTSSLIALTAYAADVAADEFPHWADVAAHHFAEVRAAFAALRPEQRVIFFCHDPTALPFLGSDPVIQSKLNQVERTVIGHLHSNLYLRLSKLLSGMPTLRGLGHSAYKMSQALGNARAWHPFRVLLCPSLAGIELLKDGGFYTVELTEGGPSPARFQFHPLKR
jgi:hypothetical protein